MTSQELVESPTHRSTYLDQVNRLKTAAIMDEQPVGEHNSPTNIPNQKSDHAAV